MPRYSAKPNVDWAYIEQRVKAGESFRSIEESLPKDAKVSHQGISKRAEREGWTREAQLKLAAKQFKVAEGLGKNTVERKLAIIKDLENGLLLKTAAMANGVSESTLHQWRREDEVFAAECDEAQERFIRENLGIIQQAGRRGDWKAAQWMLGKHPRSKADYAEEKQQGGASLNIVLSIPKPGGEIRAIEEAKVELIEDRSNENS
jgi:hypothetical protein